MLDDYKIRRSITDSSNSVDRENFVDVNIENHSKIFPFPSVSDTIDQRQVFEEERNNATKYRLILTILPYCSNVLFNAATEIVQNEGIGDKNQLVIVGKNNVKVNTGVAINGKNTVNNVDMIRNTEYSNGDKPFVYHCGYDIFNNHILRNQTFKLVNPIVDNNDKDNYNTIRDYMRRSNGEKIYLYRRTNIDTIETSKSYKHMYLKDDVLNLTDSINTNLYEQNGWYGFGNRSTIPSCKFDGKKWCDLKISKVFNTEITDEGNVEDRLSCGFVEMYPDSSLYSFSPKYNSFQNREEQNWDICITYPYENDDGYKIDNDGSINVDKVLINGIMNDGKTIVNGLLISDYIKTIGTSGQDIILFRTYIKHNLSIGDRIKLFYSNSTDKVINFNPFNDKIFTVVNTGNLDGDDKDYYFYINDVDYFDSKNFDFETEHTFRFIKINNDRDCKYYYRRFKKLPNFKSKKEELKDEVARDKDVFEGYVKTNGTKGNKMRLFNKEQYPLAFSKTSYGDQISQVTFTDSIDIDKIVDNLGRPLTNLYITIIKRNAGHNLWYKSDKTNDDCRNIEYSHCFGEVKSGLEIHGERSDDEVKINDRKELSDVTTIKVNDSYGLDNDITIDTDEFYGDVVELDMYNIRETTLSDVCFRFNTEQREHVFSDTEINYDNFTFDEILSDDYDLNNFQCVEYKVNETNPYTDNSERGQKTLYRPEGYYYKAHYPIMVREFGAMNQGSYKEVKVVSATPRQSNGMFIEVVTSLRSGVMSGSIVYLCNNDETVKIPLTVHSVQSNVRFLLNPMNVNTDNNYLTVFQIVNGLLYSNREIKQGETWVDKEGNEHYAIEDTTQDDYNVPLYTLKLKDNSIPYYAQEVATNIYLWRDLLNVGNKDTIELEEYPFANGHFYINKQINFFLKRQDPFGYNGLMNKYLWPNDIYGNVKKVSNYLYKDDSNEIC